MEKKPAIKTEYQHEHQGWSVYKLHIPISLKDQSDYMLKKQLRDHIRHEIGRQTVSKPEKIYQRPHLRVTCDDICNRRLYVMHQHSTDF